MALHGKEKIWFLVNRLSDERAITKAGEPIGLHPMQELNNHYLPQDLINLLEKLEADGAAKLVQMPTDQTYHKYLIELLPGFDDYASKLEDDPEYLEWSGKKPKRRGVSFGKQVDFTKEASENSDTYISIGQIQELLDMPKSERDVIIKRSLTDKQRKDVEEYPKQTKKLLDNLGLSVQQQLKGLSLNLPEVNYVLPPNYQAEQVGLLRRLVQQKEQENSDEPPALSIAYSGSRQIVLNGVFQIAKPNLNSTNDLVFSHLYANPGKTFSRQQLEEATGEKFTKTLHKIVENLGFKGDLAKAFFTTSKNDIVFRNPISRDELNEMGLGNIKLNW